MTIKYRTAGSWGAGLGRNLTPTEVDQNFWDLQQFMDSDETDDIPPVGIANIIVTSSQMTIVLDNAVTLGPYNLPFATFRWAGTWLPSTNFANLDVIRVRGVGVFLCLQTHISDVTFDPAASNTDGNLYQQIWGTSETFGKVTAVATDEYTLQDLDVDGGLLRFAIGCRVTIPSESTDFDPPIGEEISLEQDGVNSVQVEGDGGAVTINVPLPFAPRTGAQFATITLKKVAADEWTLRGYLGELGTETETAT